MIRYNKLVHRLVNISDNGNDSGVKALFGEVGELLPPVIRYHFDLDKNEKKTYKAEEEIFSLLNKISAQELNQLYKRGLFSKWFF